MKAILVIEMPETCEECHLRNYNQCYGLEFDRTLIEKRDGEEAFKTRNKICPLKPMQRKVVNRSTEKDNQYYYDLGFNDCIDEILRGNV